jgi:hypothetical protein
VTKRTIGPAIVSAYSSCRPSAPATQRRSMPDCPASTAISASRAARFHSIAHYRVLVAEPSREIDVETGGLENAQAVAAHESPRTTKLYDRTGDEITLDEVEWIRI